MILYGILWRVQWLHFILCIFRSFLTTAQPNSLNFSQLQGTNQRLLTSFAMQSFCQFYAETCNLTDYLENCSVSFSVARRLCRLCLLPCISCISCPKDVRKFCPFIYFLPTWHPFNDNLLEIVSCFLCCLLFTLYAACVASLLFSLVSFFRARLTHIFVSIVFPFQMCSLSLSLSPALLPLLWQLCFPFLANSFLWKCWKAEKFIAVKCRRHTADSGTVRLTDRQIDRLRERQSVCRLANWPKGAAFVEKNMTTPRQAMPRYATQAGCAQWEAFKLAAPHGRDTSRHRQTMCTM